MRLLILSDLHREIYPNRDLGINLEVSKPDVVILAGDIDKEGRSIKWASDMFPTVPVLYVAGNHEFYGSQIDTGPHAIYAAVNETPNVHFLNRDEFIFGDVRFLGSTLWTDFNLFGLTKQFIAFKECKNVMNDYYSIRVAKEDNRRLNPMDTKAIHDVTVQWLKYELTMPFEGKTVVISHHAPSMRSVPLEYSEDISSAAYASNLDDLASRADLWIHGHTHTSMDYQLDKCRVVCNPCGYVLRKGGNENPDFNPNFVVEI